MPKSEVFNKFKINDEVEVIPSELSMWKNVLNHDRTKYRVVGISSNDRICCAGHPQHLILDEGTQASGAWFDSNCSEPLMCSGGLDGRLHRDVSGWRWE